MNLAENSCSHSFVGLHNWAESRIVGSRPVVDRLVAGVADRPESSWDRYLKVFF
jgi:hypothetical protein